MTKVQFQDRTYYFPYGIYTARNVIEQETLSNGSDCLLTVDEKHFIIPKGFLAIEINIKES